jgi:hypothetical protein
MAENETMNGRNSSFLSRWAPLFLVVLSAAGIASAAPAAPNFAGRWEGVLIFTAAEDEIDFTVDLESGSDKTLLGKIELPAVNQVFSLENVRVNGSTLSFEIRDKNGVRAFSGVLAGGVIRGNCVRASGSLPFEMRRPDKNALRQKPTLQVLSGGPLLGPIFDRDRDYVRLLLLLSPT